MDDSERFKLCYGPYATPLFNYGDSVMDGVQHERAGEPRRAERVQYKVWLGDITYIPLDLRSLFDLGDDHDVDAEKDAEADVRPATLSAASD